jgi:aryl-alcohol dehydrogenase-like predicted oxidoreductase
VAPIPGTKRRKYLEENLGALEVEITEQDESWIDAVLPPGAAVGTRYAEAAMQFVDG